MVARGAVVAACLATVALPLFAAPVGAVHDVARYDGVDSDLARAVAAGELPLDLLFLPDSLHGTITGAALDGVDDLTRTSLPGPNTVLLPDGSDGRTLLQLIRASGTLPTLPSADLQRLLAVAPGATTGAVTTTSPSTNPTHTSTDTTTDASDHGSGSYAARTTGHAAPTTPHQASTTPTSSSGVLDAWRDLSPEQKAAIGAGLLGLLLFAPFAMYSRISRDEALQNPTRARIYEIVCTDPGTCIKDIAEGADVSYSTATYHLDRLKKDDYIVSMDEGNKVTFFKNGGRFGPQDRELVPLLNNEEAMRVFESVLANPWCYRAQVAEMLGVSHTTVNWHLKRLTDAGLVTEHREGRACHLMVPDEAMERLERVMAKLDEATPSDEAPAVAVSA